MKQTKLVEITDIEKQKAILEEAGRIIRDGGLVVFPTETVYGIGANGLDADACRSIYVAKGRPSDNPLILTVPDEEGARQAAAVIPPTAQKLMDRFWPGPLTIVLPRKPIVPDAATGGLDTVALRCPDHDICRAFLRCAGVPVAGPSANLSTRPSPTTAEEVMHDMDGRVDMVIDGGPCHIGVESTIVECNGDDGVTILRPGGVTIEMLQEVVPHVRLDTTLVTGKGVPKAPGMKYRHYAPKGNLTIVEGPQEKVTACINEKLSEGHKQGLKTGVIATDETIEQYQADVKRSLGSRKNEEAIAHHLFEVLRQMDDEEVQLIFTESFAETGLGQATMNRLLKAAGHQVISL